MVKTTPLPFKNKSPLLFSAYGHLYSTIPNLVSRHFHSELDGSLRHSNDAVGDARRRSTLSTGDSSIPEDMSGTMETKMETSMQPNIETNTETKKEISNVQNEKNIQNANVVKDEKTASIEHSDSNHTSTLENKLKENSKILKHVIHDENNEVNSLTRNGHHKENDMNRNDISTTNQNLQSMDSHSTNLQNETNHINILKDPNGTNKSPENPRESTIENKLKDKSNKANGETIKKEIQNGLENMEARDKKLTEKLDKSFSKNMDIHQTTSLSSFTSGQKKNRMVEWPHIYLFGSLSLNEDNQLCVPSSNCFKFDWSKGDWEKQDVSLEARYQYASCQFGNKVLLHGGFTNFTKEQIISSIQIFDMETMELQTIKSDLALACHAGTYHGASNSFIVYGGISTPFGKCSNATLSKFSIDKQSWETIKTANDITPKARYGHSLVSYGDSYLVLFGGKDQDDELLNDLWFFDMRTRNWEEIVDTMGDMPPGRVFHYAVRHHHTMYILGGDEPQDADDNNHPLYALDLKTRHWDAHRLTGGLNTRRMGVTMTLFSNELIGESLIAYGGIVKSKRHMRASDNRHIEVTVPLSNKMFHITSIPQYKLKRKLEALGTEIVDRPKKRQKISPRKLVAAYVDSEWILARIVRTLDNNYYELEDAQAVTEDNEEDKAIEPKSYIVCSENIARLSTSMKDHIPLPSGTRVLALYPGTSCLYPGVIEDHGDESYYVLFEDDEEDGETPLREIGYKLICPFQEGVLDE